MAERSAKQLGLSKADLPNSVIEVIATLSKSGFEAYIVGGGVRDTLLGLSPKDFDAVTDAKPHEVKDLFGKRCRIIGRRFQLAHVYSGRDMIEVATFRAPPNGDAHTTSDGMIVRDNVWGDIEQDFARRDFSINAMYYQPIKGVVHDFCNALDDIKTKTLRLLGHAPVRVEEDPVRLLRALRFKAKLGFDFDKELSQQFHDDNWALLEQVSPHRLYDESQKMFTGGYLVPLLPLLFEYGAIRHLIIYPPEKPTALVNQVAINTDKRIAQGKSINPAFFYAALLWDNYLYQLAKYKKKNMPFHDAQLQAASKVIDRQRIKTAIPKFAEQFIRDIWLMQPKLASPRVNQITQLAEQPRFRAAFDFLLLREHCDDASNPLSESTNGMGEWWQTYQTLSDKQKQQAIDDFAGDSRRGANKRSRGRNRNRSRDVAQETDTKTTSTNDQKQAATNSSSAADNDSRNTKSDSRKDGYNRQDNQPHAGNGKGHSSQSNRSRQSQAQPQDTHYAREREQLQKLSLGELAGAQAESSNQPQPLFTINAAKMAKQVPQQAAIAKQAAQAKPIVNQPKPVADKPKPTAVAKASEPKMATKKDVVQDLSKLADTDAVLLPKEERVPSKRRRREPSSTVTQSERANGVSATDSATTSVEAHANNTVATAPESKAEATSDKPSKGKRTRTRKAAPKTEDKPVTTAKQSKANQQAPAQDSKAQSSDTAAQSKPIAKKRTPKKAANSNAAKPATNGTQNNERVPATRRRRQPSSDQTVAERLAANS